MKSESDIPGATPVGTLNSERDLGAESDLPLPITLPRSLQMNFTIEGEDFNFTLTVDDEGNLISFTATKGSGITNDTFNCSIQVESQSTPPEVFCCTPAGCTAGPC